MVGDVLALAAALLGNTERSAAAGAPSALIVTHGSPIRGASAPGNGVRIGVGASGPLRSPVARLAPPRSLAAVVLAKRTRCPTRWCSAGAATAARERPHTGFREGSLSDPADSRSARITRFDGGPYRTSPFIRVGRRVKGLRVVFGLDCVVRGSDHTGDATSGIAVIGNRQSYRSLPSKWSYAIPVVRFVCRTGRRAWSYHRPVASLCSSKTPPHDPVLWVFQDAGRSRRSSEVGDLRRMQRPSITDRLPRTITFERREKLRPGRASDVCSIPIRLVIMLSAALCGTRTTIAAKLDGERAPLDGARMA